MSLHAKSYHVFVRYSSLYVKVLSAINVKNVWQPYLLNQFYSKQGFKDNLT